MECPVCKLKIHELSKGTSRRKLLQHHYWGAHNVEVMRAHELARLTDEGQLTEADIAELSKPKT